MVDLLREFLNETRDNLAQLDDDILALERDPANADLLARAFRVLHTVKGSCGFLKLPRLEGIARQGEHLLGALRDGQLSLNAPAIALILSIVSMIRSVTTGLEENGTEPPGDDDALEHSVRAVLQGEAAAPVLHTAETAVRPSATLRVSVGTLDDLMNLMSELVLARNDLLQAAHVNNDVPLLQKIQVLNNRIAALQECIVKTRMQPIRRMWQSLPRLTRDTAAERNKSVDLVMTGDDTELDRQMAEQLKEVFVHLIRNAVDHGIEDSVTRAQAGKPATGTIRLHAAQHNSHIVITMEDDGRGLDRDTILHKAAQKNIAVPANATDADIRNLIFAPGFSTADTVTDISGRGVGLDVVKTQIEKIGGHMTVTSEAGRLCRFTLTAPLTVAIIPVLLIRAEAHVFAIPQTAVTELLRLPPASPLLKTVGDGDVLEWRGAFLPVLSLRDTLSLPTRYDATDILVLAVLTHAGRSFAVVIGTALTTEEIIVKPLPRTLSSVAAFTGTTILGDGAAVMILNPAFLAEQAGAAVFDDAAHRPGVPSTNAARTHRPHLIFRTRLSGVKAVPLGMIDSLDRIDASLIDRADGRAFIAYRDGVLPLIAYDAQDAIHASGAQNIIVVAHQGKKIGLCVEAVHDIVDTIDTPDADHIALVDGHAVALVDMPPYLARRLAEGRA